MERNSYNDVMSVLTNGFDGENFDGENFDGENFDGENFIGDLRTQMTRPLPLNISQFTFRVKNTTGLDQLLALTTGGLKTSRACKITAGNIVAIGGGALATSETIDFNRYDDPRDISKVTGKVVTAVLDDDIIYATVAAPTTAYLKVTALTSPVRSFNAFFEKNSAIIDSIVINASDKALFDSALTIKSIDPFKVTGEEVVQLNDFLAETQFNDKKITVKPELLGKHIQLDNQTVILMAIPGTIGGVANVEFSVQFNLKAINNSARVAYSNYMALLRAANKPKVVAKPALKK